MNQRDLIPDLHTVANGDVPRDHPRLILPRLLEHATITHRLSEADEKAAHAVVLKWADMESRGRLAGRSEAELEGEFLTEIFGQVLGYTLFSEDRDYWELRPKFSVNGGIADAAIGRFREGGEHSLRALIELKGPTANIDRDRFGGRTPVQQCWDYLNARPDCPWGIVCNYVGFRLYHRTKGWRAYEHYTLQDLREKPKFREFRILFGRDGLVPLTAAQRPLLDRLLERTGEKQREVGKELYEYYHDQRVGLIAHLREPPHNKSLDEAVRIAQKLVDRVIFVAFCEDRYLLPDKLLEKAYTDIGAFPKVTNPRWQSYLELFHRVDKGNAESNIPPFDGGLFRHDAEVDELDLGDDRVAFFRTIGQYDFRDEVNVDVLGHLFEHSINDIERIKTRGLFGEAAAEGQGPRMAKSAERKRGGIYYTPPEFTDRIVTDTVRAVIDARLAAVAQRHGVDPEAAKTAEPNPELAPYWSDCFDALRRIKVCDPACGSGAFLIRAYEEFHDCYKDVLRNWGYHDPDRAGAIEGEVPDIILGDNLYGVDLSREAVEITQLALWIRSARPEKTLADLSRNIVCGNSLIDDPEVDPDHAMDWREAFPQVFDSDDAGFDCVIGNPPWERMKLQEREFFDAAAPEIASAVSAATRRKCIAQLQETKPELHERYVVAKEAAEAALAHVRASDRFPLTAKGDINTYALFAELACTIISPHGRVGLLVPSGIATDKTTRGFFAELVKGKHLAALYDFENKAPIFPDVHRSYKFCILLFGGAEVTFPATDFVFFAHTMDDLAEKGRHIPLTARDIRLLNPNTRTCPIFRSRRDADLTRAVYRRVPVLVDRSRDEGGNPWGVRFLTMFHQTNDAELFRTAEQLKADGFKPRGRLWKKGKRTFLPLYEAKMVQAFDHRAASVVVDPENWMRQGQTRPTSNVEHQNPEFFAEPRFWVEEPHVDEVLGPQPQPAYLCFKDVTSATNQRTMIAAFIPKSAVMNSAPLLLIDESLDARNACCLLANLNSFAYDFVARQKVGGVHLNFFIVEQLPTLAPDAYDARCPWDRRRRLRTWISDRVLKLTCTADDMKPLARAAGLKPLVHKWHDEERETLRAELDAAYFLLYGIEREDAEYILSTFQGAGDASEGLLDGLSVAQRVLTQYDHLRERAVK